MTYFHHYEPNKNDSECMTKGYKDLGLELLGTVNARVGAKRSTVLIGRVRAEKSLGNVVGLLTKRAQVMLSVR